MTGGKHDSAGAGCTPLWKTQDKTEQKTLKPSRPKAKDLLSPPKGQGGTGMSTVRLSLQTVGPSWQPLGCAGYSVIEDHTYLRVGI